VHAIAALLLGAVFSGNAADIFADRPRYAFFTSPLFDAEYPKGWRQGSQPTGSKGNARFWASNPEDVSIKVYIFGGSPKDPPVEDYIRKQAGGAPVKLLKVEHRVKPGRVFETEGTRWRVRVVVLQLKRPGHYLSIKYSAPPGKFQENLPAFKHFLDTLIVKRVKKSGSIFR